MLVDELADLQDVGRRSDKGHADVVHAVPESELEVLAIFLGEGRHGERGPGKVDTLVVADNAPGHDPARDLVALDRFHVERDPPVVDQNAVARLDVAREPRVRDCRPLRRPRHDLRRQDERAAAAERRAPLGERPEADLRALQVREHRDRLPDSRLDRADPLDRLAVLRVGAVGKVQARDVHSRTDHLLDDALADGGGPDGADDLGQTLVWHRSVCTSPRLPLGKHTPTGATGWSGATTRFVRHPRPSISASTASPTFR